MKASIVVCSFGLLAFDEQNKLIGKALFPAKSDVAAKALEQLEKGKLVDQAAELVTRIKEDYETFVFENAALAKDAEAKLGVRTEVSKPSDAGELVRSQTEKFAVKTGFVENAEEFALWAHNLSMEVAKLRVKGAVEKRDLIVGQAIQSLDEVDKITNLLMSRVREWFGVHFPELDRLLDKHETYARLIVNLGNRGNFTVDNLKNEGIPDAKAEGIAKTVEKSMGADLSENDLVQIQLLCGNVLALYGMRENLGKYLDSTMEEVAPNTKALVGSLLGARLIAISGGILGLARKPASTIQVLGAEKALFRSLKTGTRPPKHGIIFQHTMLHDAKRWQRGKIARALAGKLAIAARADAFGQRDISEALNAILNKRVEEIREKYAEPPPLPPEKPKHERPRENRKKWRNHKRGR